MVLHQEIYECLKDVARRKDLITYQEIAPLAGLDMESQVDRNKLGEILGEISTFEHKHGRPMLSSLVVLSGIGYPGEGYFKLARYLDLYQGKGEFEDLDFFVQEVKKVYDYWKDQ